MMTTAASRSIAAESAHPSCRAGAPARCAMPLSRRLRDHAVAFLALYGRIARGRDGSGVTLTLDEIFMVASALRVAMDAYFDAADATDAADAAHYLEMAPPAANLGATHTPRSAPSYGRAYGGRGYGSDR